jgi:hypothetical protein
VGRFCGNAGKFIDNHGTTRQQNRGLIAKTKNVAAGTTLGSLGVSAVCPPCALVGAPVASGSGVVAVATGGFDIYNECGGAGSAGDLCGGAVVAAAFDSAALSVSASLRGAGYSAISKAVDAFTALLELTE